MTEKEIETTADAPQEAEPTKPVTFGDAVELAVQQRCQCGPHTIATGTVVGRLVPATDVPRDFLLDALRNGIVAVAVP